MDACDLQSQKLLIETIFQHIPQYIFWKNPQSVYLGCNDNYAKLLGLASPKDIVGKTDYEIDWLPDGDTADKFRAGDQATLAGRCVTNEEEWLSLKNGRRLLTLVNKVPLVDERGVIVGVLGVATDITEKKQIEERLAKTDHQLQGMTLVSASMAHELRTPLAALKSATKGINQSMSTLIAGYQAAVKENLPITTLSPTKLRLLMAVVNSLEDKVDECNRVIDMVLTNISARREERMSNTKKCSANHCINRALAQYKPSRGNPKIIWENNSDFVFYGKEILLVHVLFNLLKNAIYFIRKAGKGDIHIWIDSTEHENTIHFKDTGTGIRPENLSKIFTPFFTADTNKGTGIGLAFCDITLRSLGGRITCQSQWQEYTEFFLSFPKNPQQELP